MSTMAAEMQSFMWIFTQLCNNGVNASMNFNSNGGNIFVSLHADLGNPSLFFHDFNNVCCYEYED